MDNTSKWHTMGLLSVAMETCFLPTRIRDNDSTGFLGRLDDMATLLNVSGNQKIASLAMSVHEAEREMATTGYSQMPPMVTSLRDSATKIVLSWDSGETRIRGRKINNDGHIFAEAEVLRGFNEEQVLEETASSSRTHQKTDQRAAQRKAQLAHDRQDAILGRWGTTLHSLCTIVMCFAFFGYNTSTSPQRVYKATKMWQIFAVDFGTPANGKTSKKQNPHCLVAVCCEVFFFFLFLFLFKISLHWAQKSPFIPNSASLLTGSVLHWLEP